MMTEAELKKAFPYGAMLIPEDEDTPSTPVSIGAVDEDFPTHFHAWRSAYHDIYLSLDLTPSNDGFETTNGSGAKYFMRPLTKDQKVSF